MKEELEVLTFPNKDCKEIWYWYIVTVPTDAYVSWHYAVSYEDSNISEENAASIHFNLKDEGSTFLQNVGTYLQDQMPQPRTPQSVLNITLCKLLYVVDPNTQTECIQFTKHSILK
jgi:hypothetical protein